MFEYITLNNESNVQSNEFLLRQKLEWLIFITDV